MRRRNLQLTLCWLRKCFAFWTNMGNHAFDLLVSNCLWIACRTYFRLDCTANPATMLRTYRPRYSAIKLIYNSLEEDVQKADISEIMPLCKSSWPECRILWQPSRRARMLKS
jgi:hypothetical protein